MILVLQMIHKESNWRKKIFNLSDCQLHLRGTETSKGLAEKDSAKVLNQSNWSKNIFCNCIFISHQRRKYRLVGQLESEVVLNRRWPQSAATYEKDLKVGCKGVESALHILSNKRATALTLKSWNLRPLQSCPRVLFLASWCPVTLLLPRSPLTWGRAGGHNNDHDYDFYQ